MDRDALDLVLEDMSEHQRRFGMEPTPEANHALVAPELERIERMQVLEHPEGSFDPGVVAELELAAAQRPTTVEGRKVDERSYMVKVANDAPSLVRRATTEEAWFYAHAMPRIYLLLSLAETGAMGQASWRARTQAVMSTREKAGAWAAAAEMTDAQILQMREDLRKDQRMLKVLGLEVISQLTREWCRATQKKLEQQFVNELCLLLEESNTLGFGDWQADPEKKIQVQV